MSGRGAGAWMHRPPRRVQGTIGAGCDAVRRAPMGRTAATRVVSSSPMISSAGCSEIFSPPGKSSTLGRLEAGYWGHGKLPRCSGCALGCVGAARALGGPRWTDEAPSSDTQGWTQFPPGAPPWRSAACAHSCPRRKARQSCEGASRSTPCAAEGRRRWADAETARRGKRRRRRRKGEAGAGAREGHCGARRVDEHMPVGQHERVHSVRLVDDGQTPLQLLAACRKVGRLPHRAHDALRCREHRMLHHIDLAVAEAEWSPLERRRRHAVKIHRQQDLVWVEVASYGLHGDVGHHDLLLSSREQQPRST